MNNNGDETIWFRQIFNTYYRGIKNYIYYKTGKVETSEDLIQDVFLKLWEHKNNIDKESIKPFLYKTVNNMLANYYKKENIIFRFTNSLLTKNNNESPEFLLELKDFDERLQRSISNLPEKCRVVFLMNRIDNLKYHEIATTLGLTQKAVEKRMSKALSILKETIGIKV